MNKDLEKDVEQITSFQLEEIKGGVNEANATTKCGACCSLLGGGGSASLEQEELESRDSN